MSSDWQIQNLNDVCEVIAGQSPKSEFYNKSGEGLAFYQGKKDFGTKYINPPTTWTTKITKEAVKDDILMSVRAPVGPINFSTEKVCIGRGLAAIRASNKIDKEFLFYFLLKHESEIIGNTGAVFNSINKTQIGAIPIPVPSLDVQKQIVAILDQAFAVIDQAQTNIQQNIQNAQDLFQSKLNQIFSQQGEGWEEKKLKEITTKIGSGSTPRGGQAAYKESGISLIRSMNVHDDGFRENKLAFIDDEQADKLKNVVIEEEDVLLNITGASVARCCIVDPEYLPARVNQHVSIIRLEKEILEPTFLHYALTSKSNKDKLLGIGEQGSTRQAITKVQIEDFKVSYPKSLEEQNKLLVDLRAIETKTRELENSYSKKLLELEELKKSLLQKAFKGELTQEKQAA